MMEITTTMPLASHIRFLSEMWTLSDLARMSLVTEDADTSSWELAVDMIAARMAANTTPRMNGALVSKSFWAVYMKTNSASLLDMLRMSTPLAGR